MQLIQELIQEFKALINGFGEGFFFHLNGFPDIVLLFFQFRISNPIFLNDRITNFIQERLGNTNHSAESCCTAQQTTQYIASSFVGWCNPISNHERGAADVVGNNTQCNVCLLIVAVVNICNLADMLHDVLYGINFKQIIDTLHYTSQPFQTHTGINILVLHFGIVTISIAVKLAEYQVPNFYIAVAFAANCTIRFAAALFRSTVKVNFRTWAAWTGTVFPEVIFFSQTNHMRFCNANVLGPQIIRFIIIFKYRNIQLIFRHFQNLGKEFPCPFNGFYLEVISKRKIAQHFKISTVPSRLANSFNIRCTNTFLASCHPCIRRNSLSQEVFFHRCHTGIDQQQALIALRHQRIAGQSGMSLALKK